MEQRVHHGGADRRRGGGRCARGARSAAGRGRVRGPGGARQGGLRYSGRDRAGQGAGLDHAIRIWRTSRSAEKIADEVGDVEEEPARHPAELIAAAQRGADRRGARPGRRHRGSRHSRSILGAVRNRRADGRGVRRRRRRDHPRRRWRRSWLAHRPPRPDAGRSADRSRCHHDSAAGLSLSGGRRCRGVSPPPAPEDRGHARAGQPIAPSDSMRRSG